MAPKWRTARTAKAGARHRCDRCGAEVAHGSLCLIADAVDGRLFRHHRCPPDPAVERQARAEVRRIDRALADRLTRDE